MWLVKFCFSNLSGERVDSEKFHDQTLRWSNLNQNQHFLPFCQKLDLEEKEEPWLFLQQNPLCFSDGCFNSKMSALLLINGRRYDFGVNHGNVFQILRHFWLDKSVLFFILHPIRAKNRIWSFSRELHLFVVSVRWRKAWFSERQNMWSMVFFHNINPGARVQVKWRGEIEDGTIRYVGKLVTKDGDWAGLELDNRGSVNKLISGASIFLKNNLSHS